MVDGDDVRRCDILVVGDRVARIESTIEDGGAEIIDASNCIVHPGFIDTHRHVWQTQLRTVATDWSLFDYVAEMRCVHSAFYSPDDVYLGNYAGALEAVNAGITTLVDHCHIINSADHATEAVRGLTESGIRAEFCYGFWPNPTSFTPFTAVPGEAWRFDVARALRKGPLSSDDARVRLGIAPSELEGMPFELTAQEIAFARDLEVACLSLHVAMGAYDGGHKMVEQLHKAGLLREDMVFVHGSALTDHELRLLADTGCGLSVTPETELQMAMGIPVASRSMQAGVHTGIGIDIVSNYSGDMFAQMRILLQTMRSQINLEYQRRGQAPKVITPKAMDVLRMATIGGAKALKLGREIGTLEVGKKADIVLTSTASVHMTPAVDACGALVLNANVGDVDTVLIDGRILKRGGRLVGVDWGSLSRRLQASSDRVVEQSRQIPLAPIRAFVNSIMPMLA